MVLAQKNEHLWPQAMVKVAFAHNISINDTMGMVQYENMTCSVLKKGLNNGRGFTAMGSKEEETNEKDVVEILSSTKTDLNKEVRERTVQAQKTRTEECFHRGDPYKVGDEVLIMLSTTECEKLRGSKFKAGST